jgi:hypothetical protein
MSSTEAGRCSMESGLDRRKEGRGVHREAVGVGTVEEARGGSKDTVLEARNAREEGGRRDVVEWWERSFDSS